MQASTILLVEDNPDDEALTLRALGSSGVGENVVVVRDGAEALDYLFGSGPWAGRDLATQPGLILLDLKLPKIDGLEVLRRVRTDARTRRACVVVFTSSGEDSDIQRAYEHAANSFVRKPVAFENFSAAVERIAHYWLRLNEPAPRHATHASDAG